MNNAKNSVSLVGRLGTNPEVKEINGKKLAKFPIATITWHRGEAGKPVSRLEWYNVVAWGRQADLVEVQLKKGTQASISGELRSRDYRDGRGMIRHVTEVVIKSFTVAKPAEPVAMAS